MPGLITNRRAWQRDLPHYQSDFRTYFVTFSTKERTHLVPIARTIALQRIVFDHLRRIFLHAAVVMPDHVHLVCTPMPDQCGDCWLLSKIMQGIKGASARTINRALGTDGQVWQHESFDHELRSDENLRAICEYVCNNPVRAGLVERADDYPWIWREWIEGRRLRAGAT